MRRQDNGKEVLIRKTAERDRGALVDIIGRTANLNGEEKECAVELLEIYFNNPLQKDYFFITAADASDLPAGYACYGPRPLADAVWDLYWIVVDPGWQGRGVGRKLVRATEEMLRGLGARLLVAETSGLPEYAATRGFYSRTGFMEEARINGFYKPGDDLVLYIKRF